MQNPTTPENTQTPAPSRLAVVKAERSKARAACVAARMKAEAEKRKAARWARAFPDGAPPLPLYVSNAEKKAAREALKGSAPSRPVSAEALRLETLKAEAKAEKRRAKYAESAARWREAQRPFKEAEQAARAEERTRKKLERRAARSPVFSKAEQRKMFSAPAEPSL